DPHSGQQRVDGYRHINGTPLVFFNLLFPDGMTEWNRRMKRTGSATADQLAGAKIQAYVGIAILVLVVLRLALRIKDG
ncbi:hypothetical protein ACC736_39905, partial [Rhizobium ruizarguesonis]